MKKDKKTLEKLYYEDCLTQDEIGEIYGVHRKTVSRWMSGFGIRKKTRKEITAEINRRHMEKYGVKTPAERKEVAEKMMQTNQERYGNNSSLHGVNQQRTEAAIEKSIGVRNPSLLSLSEEALEVLSSKESFERYLLNEDNTSSRIISSKLNISYSTFNKNVGKYGLEHLVDRQSSRGVSLIEWFLNSNSIAHKKEFTYDDCRGDKLPLPFDFKIIDMDILIEFDGRQHFESIEYWGGQEGFEKRRRYDKIKTEYAKENNIKLIRFNHLQSDEEIIEVLKSIKI